MTKKEIMPKYQAGERACPICSAPLPAHQTWRGARYRFCGQAECAAIVEKMKGGRYVHANEQKCQAGGCDNFVPAGWYANRPNYLSCSGQCCLRRSLRGNHARKCGCGCGQNVYRSAGKKKVLGLVFVSREHRSNHRRNRYLTANCGNFKDLALEYINGFAALHYAPDGRKVQSALGRFFRFLNAQGIASLEDVTARTITQYLAWSERSGWRGAGDTISRIATFFNWQILEGRRQAGNPVIGLLHNARRKQSVPRPLLQEDLNLAWKLLEERGNARLRLATAIAEEAGLRNGEICRLRIADVDMVEQRLFVRLPTKTKRERFAHFSHQTKRRFEEWMKERDPDCGHDFLLHNFYGRPCQVTALGGEFHRVLCKTYKGRPVNETGFDRWSIHRLRHTMATNLTSGGADAATVMAAGGWRSFSAMAGYAQVDPAVARRGYEQAMRRAMENNLAVPRTTVLTPAQLLERQHLETPKERPGRPAEHCV